MPASKHLRVLSVRLPEQEVRKVKSLAASRGVSVQEAVHQALEIWATETQRTPQPLDALQGSLGQVDFEACMRRERETELAKDQRGL